MKKIVLFFSIFCILSIYSSAQEKLQFGLSTEGSWFMPTQQYGHDWDTQAGFGTGLGAFASQDVFWRFAGEFGITYRYKQMQQHYTFYPENGESNPDTGYDISYEGWDKYQLHYIVVPVQLRLLVTRNLFIKGGIEASWLLNYESKNKPEYNWTIGLGSQRNKLKWSVNYIRGFEEQGYGNSTPEPDGHYKISINRNNMLQLSLSYPIWQKK
jgi:hypothetical protein